MSYRAPVQDMLFVINELAPLSEINALPGCEEATPDTVQAVLEECARFTGEVVAPLNRLGDLQPSAMKDGQVVTTPGFKDAFKAFAQGGWQGMQHPQQYGGQGLPKLVAAACMEMLNSANLSFALCPLLSDSAIEALLIAGTDEQKAAYLEKLISGEWTGTMNLTEPQAGSDLALLRARAVPQGDGSYKLTGTKIFITYGEHDMADNIVHMVLARTPDAPEGVKGISLFLVPKFILGPDGKPGQRNDITCVSLEHKMGIKASPTAVLQYGEHGGATAYLIGQENRGLETMFIMMNAARFAVGMQGIAVAERAYQKAVAYARERVQSRDVGGGNGAVAIIHHPDVRRMLLSMRAQTEAARALAFVAAAAFDAAHHHPDAAVRQEKAAFYDYLVPIVKGWSTEMAVEVASIGIQVHGGTGFIEETGAAQYYRDARILSIYEGTTAIQANDLVGRKTVRDQGAVALAIVQQVAQCASALAGMDQPELQAIGSRLAQGAQALQDVVQYVTAHAGSDVRAVYAGSVPYLKLAGIVLGGWQMGRAALVAQQCMKNADSDAGFYRAKLATARFFADHLLPQAQALQIEITQGSPSVFALAEEQF